MSDRGQALTSGSRTTASGPGAAYAVAVRVTTASDPFLPVVNGSYQEANHGTGFLLLRQVHLVQESLEARVAAKTTQDRINLNLREARISVRIGALEPLECLVLVAEPGIYAGGPVGIVHGEQPLEDSL